MILLKSVVTLGPVVEVPEIVVPVDVDFAKQGLAQRVHRVLLGLGFLFELAFGHRRALLLLELVHPLEQSGDYRLLVDQFGSKPSDFVLLSPRRPANGNECDCRQAESALHHLLPLLAASVTGQGAATQSYRPAGSWPAKGTVKVWVNRPKGSV